MLLFLCVTSCLLAAKFSWIAASCSGIRHKQESCVFVPEGFGLPELDGTDTQRSGHISGVISGLHRYSGGVCFQQCLSFNNTPTSLTHSPDCRSVSRLVRWSNKASVLPPVLSASSYEPKAMQLRHPGGVFAFKNAKNTTSWTPQQPLRTYS